MGTEAVGSGEMYAGELQRHEQYQGSCQYQQYRGDGPNCHSAVPLDGTRCGWVGSAGLIDTRQPRLLGLRLAGGASPVGQARFLSH